MNWIQFKIHWESYFPSYPHVYHSKSCVFVSKHVYAFPSSCTTTPIYEYRVVPGSRNWQVETALEFWPVSCTIFRNLLASIWGSFLRFIETGFRNWLAAFLGFCYDFSMMSMIFLWFSGFFYHFSMISIWFYRNHRKILKYHRLEKS